MAHNNNSKKGAKMIRKQFLHKKKLKWFWVETQDEYFARGGTITYCPIGEISQDITGWTNRSRHATKNGKDNSQKNCWNPHK